MRMLRSWHGPTDSHGGYHQGVRLFCKLGGLAPVVGMGDYRSTDVAEVVYGDLTERIEAQLARFNALVADDVAALQPGCGRGAARGAGGGLSPQGGGRAGVERLGAKPRRPVPAANVPAGPTIGTAGRRDSIVSAPPASRSPARSGP
jgi:hypothetical protein